MTFDMNMNIANSTKTFDLGLKDGDKLFDMNMGVATIANGGTDDYDELINKPSINNIELQGNKTAEELNLVSVDELDKKADKYDIVLTGTFSLGRKEGSVIGESSITMGQNCIASGQVACAEGTQCTASGGVAHAEGSVTTASGDASHSEGGATTASGDASHAEGMATTASGRGSHAEGQRSVASGLCSHAEGRYTIANSYAQIAQGEYNIADENTSPNSRGNYVHIIGNGTNVNNRSNAHTLDWSGNGWFAGDVYVGSASGTNKDDGSKKLAKLDEVVPVSGGQMQGALVAQSNTDYTTAQLRNVIISPNEPTDADGNNGDIWIIYKDEV